METEHGSVKHRGKLRALLQHGPPHRTAGHLSALDTAAAARPSGSLGRGGSPHFAECLPSRERYGPKGAEEHPKARLRGVSTATPNGVATPQI